MKPSEIRALGPEELAKRLEETYEELRNLRFQHATRQLQNTARFGILRRDVARIKTIMRERQLAEDDGREYSDRSESRGRSTREKVAHDG